MIFNEYTQKPSPNYSNSKIDVKAIVFHDTVSALKKGSAVEHVTNPNAKASYHFIIERDGEVIQLVDSDLRAWHAGESSWNGLEGMNGYSIGVSLVGCGICSENGEDQYGYQHNEGVIYYKKTDYHPEGYWLPITHEQKQSFVELLQELRTLYGNVPVVGHYEVSPGRKTDPAPIEDLSAYNYGDLAIIKKVHLNSFTENDAWLNVRDKPNGEIINRLAHGSKVKVFEEKEGYANVAFYPSSAPIGWVSSSFLVMNLY